MFITQPKHRILSSNYSHKESNELFSKDATNCVANDCLNFSESVFLKRHFLQILSNQYIFLKDFLKIYIHISSHFHIYNPSAIKKQKSMSGKLCAEQVEYVAFTI